jgi:hypothetical protein
MHALARTESPSPGPQAPALCALDVPDARSARGLSAWDVARYALGLFIGFVLAAAASAPGGGEVLAIQSGGAGLAALVGAGALARHRATLRAPRRTRTM